MAGDLFWHAEALSAPWRRSTQAMRLGTTGLQQRWSTSMTDDIEGRRRDAWAAICGFSYQIKTTVLRWVHLDDNTILLCECGEDIAEVRRHLDSAGDAEDERLLEQIKRRQKAVTLASREAIETLANFHAAWQSQRGRRTRLRYVTNAPAGRERRFRFPGRRAGIEAWRRVAAGVADSEETAATLAAIRGVISVARPPKLRGRAGQGLDAFRQFVAGSPDGELADFIRAVDWAVSQHSHEALEPAIEGALIRRGLASPRIAPLAASKLVVTVLDLLSRRGRKRLDRPMLLACLQDFRRDPQLSRAEAALLARLQSVEEHLALLPGIASDVRETRDTVRGLAAEFASLMSGAAAPGLLGSGVPGLHARMAPPVPDRPPMPPHLHVDRAAVLDATAADITDKAWLHLTGGAGMGKTHLARALAERLAADSPLWVTLRSDTDDARLLAHLRAQVMAWVCTESGDSSWWPAYLAGSVSVPQLLDTTLAGRAAKTLIVVDNLPDPVGERGLGHALAELALVCHKSGALLITTGHRGLSTEVTAAVPASSVIQVQAPAMNESEAMVMLQAAGAPVGISNPQFRAFLIASSRGHPSILAATVRWCQMKRWRFGEGQITELATGAAAAPEREEAVRRMVRLVADEDTRELLCRLSLIGRAFGRLEVDAVAGTEPALSMPGQLLLELVGPWVNQLGAGSWEVSPLLSSAGATLLPAGRQEDVHRSLSRALLTMPEVGLVDAVQAAVHLLLAHEWVAAGGLMIHIMSSLREPAAAAVAWPLTLVFPPGRDWPGEIDLERRLLIRAFQIRASVLDGNDAAGLQSDLDALVGAAGDSADEQRACVAALLNAGPFLPGVSCAVGVRRALQAARLLRAHPEAADVPQPLVLTWEEMVLLPMVHVTDVGDARGVLQALREMTVDELHAALDSDVATQFLEIMVDRCKTPTQRLSAEEQDWEPTLALFRDLRGFAIERQVERLETVARCAEAVTLADQLGNRDEGLAVLEGFAPDDQTCQLLTHHAMACILLDAGRLMESLGYLAAAVRTGGEGFTTYRFTSYELATEVSGRLRRWREAASWAANGIRYARSRRFTPDMFCPVEPGPRDLARVRPLLLMPFVQDLNRLELTGELALALWYGAETKRACGAMFALVRELSQSWSPQDPRYREVLRKAGYSLGWATSTAASGSPPIATSCGEEYAAPQPGVFIRQRPQLADVDTPLSLPLLWYLLGRLAAGVGLRRAALSALSQSAEAAAEDGQALYQARALLDRAIIAGALGRFEESLDDGLEAVRIFSSAGAAGEPHEQGTPEPISLSEKWRQLPQREKCAAQEELFWWTIAPALLHALASDAGPAVIGRWRSAFQERRGKLANPEYWDFVMDAARMALAPVPHQVVASYWNRMTADETALRLTLCFAVPRAVGVPLADVVHAHSHLLAHIDARGETVGLISGEFGSYIVSYWAEVADGASQLRHACQFRERIAGIAHCGDLSTACQVLLWAEEATGSSVPPEARDVLRDVASKRFGRSTGLTD